MRRAPGPTHGKTPGSGQGCSSINHSIELCCCAFGCSNRLRKGYKVIKFPADQGLWKSVKEKLQRLTQTFTSGSLEVQPKMMMRETISHMAILFIVTCPARLSVECHGLWIQYVVTCSSLYFSIIWSRQNIPSINPLSVMNLDYSFSKSTSSWPPIYFS